MTDLVANGSADGPLRSGPSEDPTFDPTASSTLSPATQKFDASTVEPPSQPAQRKPARTPLTRMTRLGGFNLETRRTVLIGTLATCGLMALSVLTLVGLTSEPGDRSTSQPDLPPRSPVISLGLGPQLILPDTTLLQAITSTVPVEEVATTVTPGSEPEPPRSGSPLPTENDTAPQVDQAATPEPPLPSTTTLADHVNSPDQPENDPVADASEPTETTATNQ